MSVKEMFSVSAVQQPIYEQLPWLAEESCQDLSKQA
jgi:hypothetical protein